ncbi:hypothetical protein [Streptomyces longisporus]|uniref:Uncharacterized protein n=1 Tax=Streptomyces longisporus TaxID=1948 RepID=A0ABN3MSK6_STRLO
MSLRLTQPVTGSGYDDAAVRQGATVAVFSTSSRGKEPAVVPDAVVSTPLKNLVAQVAPG